MIPYATELAPNEVVAIALMFIGSAIAWTAAHYAEYRSLRKHAMIAAGMALMFVGFFL